MQLCAHGRTLGPRFNEEAIVAISLYSVTYRKDQDVYEIQMPISDWLVRMAIKKKDPHWLKELHDIYLKATKRAFKGVVLDPAGLTDVTFTRLRRATFRDWLRTPTHQKLAS